MKTVIDKIVNIFTFPVQWFWKTLEELHEEGNIWKIILLFVVSLTGVGLFVLTLIGVGNYLVTYHPEWLVIAGLIMWLYAYVHSKMKKEASTPTAPVVDANMQQLQAQADREYPRMRSIIFQTLIEIAPKIGGFVPLLLSEIELGSNKCVIRDNIIFYQFKLKKTDMKTIYSLNELATFKEDVQSMISCLANSGQFPTLRLQDYQTIYGNWLCGVTVDAIEDLGSHFIIHTVFASPAYADYQHNMQLNQQTADNTTLPDATWDEFDC